jgi:GGDEF domain-containing protein
MGPKTDTSSQSTPLQRLPAPPGLAEIHQFLALAMEHPGQSVEIRWNSRDLMTKFVLTVTCQMQGKDIKWVLRGGQDEHLQPIWNYTSNDVLLVYNLIACASQIDDGITRADNVPGSGRGFADGPAKNLDAPPPVSPDGPSLPHETAAEISGRYSLFAETTELSGDFYLVPPSSVLRSIVEGKMTGCLQIQHNTLGAVTVYFKKGAAYFAGSTALTGSECVMDILSWRAGKYLFKHRATTDKTNIDIPSTHLIDRGIQLARLSDILKHMGFTIDSVPMKKSQHVGMAALSATRPPDAPFTVDQLCKLYDDIDNRSAVKQLAKRCNAPRSTWVPVFSHLLDAGIITFSNQQPAATKEPAPELVGKVIDMSLIHSVIMALRRADTGMFTYPAFLYFLEQEYFRCYRTGSALSLMILELRVVGNELVGRGPLDVPAMAEIFRRISQLKRGIDIIAHYEHLDFAMILPNTAHAGAFTFAKRLHKELTDTTLPGMLPGQLSVAMGIASIPKDCNELTRLLAAAEAAKAQSIQRRTPITLYEPSNE